jgi:hypothetical protein
MCLVIHLLTATPSISTGSGSRERISERIRLKASGKIWALTAKAVNIPQRVWSSGSGAQIFCWPSMHAAQSRQPFSYTKACLLQAGQHKTLGLPTSNRSGMTRTINLLPLVGVCNNHNFLNSRDMFSLFSNC